MDWISLVPKLEPFQSVEYSRVFNIKYLRANYGTLLFRDVESLEICHMMFSTLISGIQTDRNEMVAQIEDDRKRKN